MKTWGVSDSVKLYNIENWGDQYFNINPEGNLSVHPNQNPGPGVDMMKVVEEIKSRGLELPVLIRFQDILRHRVVALNETFAKTIHESGYRGHYRGVYPIKVNQMREVVEEILEAGQLYNYGLEAGSKGELAAVLSMDLPEDALVIVNGYKDHTVIRSALMGQKLGKKVIIVVEKFTELREIIQTSRELDVRPNIGIRAKLYAKGSGKWESSGGEFAKFGLTTPELIHAMEVMKKEKMADCFKLLHFHVGSQVSNIRTIKTAVKEATRVYAKVQKMGFKLEYLDVGGGLGVDYDGSRTDFDSSMNYGMKEYVDDVVYSIQEICNAENVPEPKIVSESGRAIAAHHSMLVLNVFGDIRIGDSPLGLEEAEDEKDVVREMRYLSDNLSNKNLLEHYHDALQLKEEALSMFNLGILSLTDRAKVEQMFWKICKFIKRQSASMKYVPEDLQVLDKHLADQYLCNFSVFQSLPDHWAIGQLFPIVPLHRHTEEPTRSATLVDITCDSDGKVSKFIDLRDIKDSLPLHVLRKGEDYYLGIFLMGAYQDIMGDLHNLFGRVNEVHVFLDESEPNGYYIEEEIQGSKVSDILSLIQYSAPYLEKRIKTQIDAKVREGVLKPKEGVELVRFYNRVLHGYTYVDCGYEGSLKDQVGEMVSPTVSESETPPETASEGLPSQSRVLRLPTTGEASNK